MKTELLRFSGAVERGPAIDAWGHWLSDMAGDGAEKS
jgi:hypothetical protein